MASNNPFEDDYDPKLPAAPIPAGPPSVPISGNPFEMEGVRQAPPPATLLGNAADVAKAASNTFTFGMRDRLGGVQRALTGEAPSYSEGVNQENVDTAMRRERSPYLSVAGDVAGGTAQAFVPGAGVIGRTAGAALGGAGRGALPSIARMAGYGVEGGVLGAAQAAGHTYTGNPEDYARNAMVGGAFGAAVGAPFGHFADVAPRSMAPTPNSQQLKASASERYTDTHDVPIDYHADQFRSALDSLQRHLYRVTDPDKSPSVFNTIESGRTGRLQADPAAPTVTPKDIDALRQRLTGVNEPGARQMREFLDRFMGSPIAQASGTDAQRNRVTQILNDARGDYRAGKRTQTVEETNQYAEDRAATANSGANSGNTYRQKLVALLNPKSAEGKWYTPEEKADIRRVTGGEGITDTMRSTGNFLKGITGQVAAGGGVAGALATGDMTPLWGMAAYPVGAAIKGIGNRMTADSAHQLADRMAQRSPLYREWAAVSPTVAGPGLGNTAEAARNALTLQMLEQLRLRGVMPSTEER
jgi:hypothetical protein